MIRLRRKKTPVERMRAGVQSVSALSDIDWRERVEAGRERADEARHRLAEARERADEAREQAGEAPERAREAGEWAGELSQRLPDVSRKESRMRFPAGLLFGFLVGAIVSLILIYRASQRSAGQEQPTNIELLPRRGNDGESGAAVSS